MSVPVNCLFVEQGSRNYLQKRNYCLKKGQLSKNFSTGMWHTYEIGKRHILM